MPRKIRKAMFPIGGLGIIRYAISLNRLLGTQQFKEAAFETKIIGLQDA
jgi:hypothetical protein